LKINLKYINLKNEENIVELKWNKCAAAGYTGRNQEAVKEHIKELKALGVPTPQKVPSIYWIEPERVSTSKTLHVIGEKTSGEVEYFLTKDNNNESYVTIASDHTDRELEKISVSKAKQVCSKIIAEKCWKVSDIYDHWDKIIIQSTIKEDDGSPNILYQKCRLKEILLPEELQKICEKDSPSKNGNISTFSGTTPIIANKVIFAKTYQLIMIDPILKREISHTYNVISLPDRS